MVIAIKNANIQILTPAKGSSIAEMSITPQRSSTSTHTDTQSITLALQKPVSERLSEYPTDPATTWRELAEATPSKFFQAYEKHATEWYSLGEGAARTRLYMRLKDARCVYENFRTSICMWSNVVIPKLKRPRQREVWMECLNIFVHENGGGSCFCILDDPGRFLIEQTKHKRVLEAVHAIAEVLEHVARDLEAGGVTRVPDPSWTVIASIHQSSLRDRSRQAEEMLWSLLPGVSSRKQVDEARGQTVQRERAWLCRTLEAANVMQTREGQRLALTCVTVYAKLFLDTIESLSRPEL